MTTHKLNPTQIAWFNQATEDQKTVFLASGTVEVGEFLNMNDPSAARAKVTFGAMLRGFRIGPSNLKTADEAVAYGTQWLAEKKAKAAGLPPLDERALGISSDNTVLLEQADDLTIRVEKMTHIGMNLCAEPMGDVIDDFLGEVDEHIARDLEPAMPGITQLVDGDADGDRQDIFMEMVTRHALYGFLVEVSTPAMCPHLKDDGSSTSASFSWGSYTSRWFYGETMQQVMAQVKPWVEGLRAEEIAEEKQKKGVPA